ncbi:glycosyltransferase [Corallibacter sp.]|uniref:glycosyltransferase n=1 Tax=Corallibacter sp. TaxID=2038084 RepID=UPI003AB5BB7E
MDENMVSIIVCCYNSAHLLDDTLTHLANQHVTESLNYEVVLVDNNSTDNTATIARTIWSTLQTAVPLHIVTEPKAGLAYARETGVKQSKGGLVIFCDDDNWLCKDYIQTAYNFMVANPDVAVLGGASQGVLEGDTPLWWDDMKKNYAVGEQALSSGDITHRGYVWGAGMVFRKALFMRLYDAGFVSMLSDRKGELLSSGGDSELCKWFIIMGYKLWYLETLTFKHYITKKRLTDAYLEKLMAGHKASHDVLGLYNWFIKQAISKEVDTISVRKRLFYLKSAISKKQKNHVLWKSHLQIALMHYCPTYPKLYAIINTYTRLKKIM